MTKDKSIELLTERYLELYSYAFSILQNRVDAEDTLHDALVETLSRTWVLNPYGYCVKTIKNKAIDLIRKRGTITQLMEGMAVQPTEEHKNEQTLQKMLASLPPPLQELVVMHDISEMTMREISEETGIGLSTVKKRINKAHKILRKKLK